MNIIFQHTWEKVVSGDKTQTRRIVTKTQGISAHAEGTVVTYHSVGNCKVGGVYSVMPARGVKGLRKVADIEITRIRREDVREITESDAVAEGFTSKFKFLETWCEINNPAAFRELDQELSHTIRSTPKQDRQNEIQHTIAQWLHHLTHHAPARYDAWALDFRVINVYADAVATAHDLLEAAQ